MGGELSSRILTRCKSERSWNLLHAKCAHIFKNEGLKWGCELEFLKCIVKVWWKKAWNLKTVELFENVWKKEICLILNVPYAGKYGITGSSLNCEGIKISF